ncbi:MULTISPECIES: glycosyltransferase family 4 protein [unclassified Flavobacterium]|uniref:glycosyltransferase family 4 protein n=1 Tax=unclassified Flavobacterium TaxID=196869 RepID=UPI001F141CAB|nr:MULTISPECIES: glycosyltransferase family 4 protein [unclassified Flavobacterium]UMY64997.1 glycosyltransferase family 4 protein [Flavobacterium sp. HJ-32-4]
MEGAPKKVLIVTYYWPPAGGPGVQRWLKFAKYLPDFGIHPVVYIPENPHYPLIDEALCADIPQNITILKGKIVEPYGLASVFSRNKTKKISSGLIPSDRKQSFLERLFLWVRGNLFIPDARVLWVKPSVRRLAAYIDREGIDTVITSGPPHSLHLIGLKLKQTRPVRWIADFRDPWTTIGYHDKLKLSGYAARRHKTLEATVLNTADLVVVTSQTTKAEFQALTATPIEVITNGYDVEKIVRPPLDEQFTVAHIGSLLSGRNPIHLWESLAELRQEEPGFKDAFSLKLVGAVSPDVLHTIQESGLADCLDLKGYLPHDEAVQAQRSAQVLLLIEIDAPETRSIIPGKLFEYMVSERPIVGIGPSGSDFAAILKETNTGTFFTYSEKEKLKDTIRHFFELYKEGTLNANGVGLQRFSRKALTGQLAQLLH